MIRHLISRWDLAKARFFSFLIPCLQWKSKSKISMKLYAECFVVVSLCCLFICKPAAHLVESVWWGPGLADFKKKLEPLPWVTRNCIRCMAQPVPVSFHLLQQPVVFRHDRLLGMEWAICPASWNGHLLQTLIFFRLLLLTPSTSKMLVTIKNLKHLLFKLCCMATPHQQPPGSQDNEAVLKANSTDPAVGSLSASPSIILLHSAPWSSITQFWGTSPNALILSVIWAKALVGG